MVQTALFFDVFFLFFWYQSILALISLNKVPCPVYGFGWPVLGGSPKQLLTFEVLVVSQFERISFLNVRNCERPYQTA